MTSLLTSLVVVVAALLVSSSALLLPTACSVCSIRPAGCQCGQLLDANGCPTGACRKCIYNNRCSLVMCMMYCQYGFCHSRVTGCPVCKCRGNPMPGPITY